MLHDAEKKNIEKKISECKRKHDNLLAQRKKIDGELELNIKETLRLDGELRLIKRLSETKKEE